MGVSSGDSAPAVDVGWGVPVGAPFCVDVEVSRSCIGVAVCWEVDPELSVVACTKAGTAVAVPSQAISRDDRRAAKTMANSAKGRRELANENPFTLDLPLSRFLAGQRQ